MACHTNLTPDPAADTAWPLPGRAVRLVSMPHPMPHNLDPLGCEIDHDEDQQIIIRSSETLRYWTLGFAFRNEAEAYALVVLLTGHAPDRDGTLGVVGAVLDGAL